MEDPIFSFLLLLLYFIVHPYPTTVPIENSHIFISGGFSGIGLSLAHRAASEGAKVSIHARSLDKLEEAKKYIQLSTDIDVTVFASDVRDYEAVSTAVVAVGPIDMLVLNQGVFMAEELEKQGLDKVRFMVDVNLMGSFNMIKAALPGMKDRKERGPGSSALMSSQVGQQEVIVDNIHVSMIFPPATGTPGLTKETKKWPQLTNIVVESSGSMKATEVVKKALDGIKSASFIVPCNFEGLLLSIATAGLSPQRSFVMAFMEVVAAGIIRISALRS
ncbi:putative 3-dehydrosphinganine reductase [Rosa chinensis]|uniref:Putative 3-dehydrosphinganine reductase n=1 Tax=Rosa chinensis TaxID=74649 RepID=A0A2P6PRB6_ROSCH|nr:putative 3-dehydrosphinganine reductase [Rosa chinensis]